MLAAFVRLVAYRNDGVPGFRLHASRVAVGYGKVDVALPDTDNPAPVILVAHLMGRPFLHVELPALGKVVHGELVDDFLLSVRLLEVAAVCLLSADGGHRHFLSLAVGYGRTRTVVQRFVFGGHEFHPHAFHSGRRSYYAPAYMRKVLYLQRLEVGFQPHVQLVRLDVRLPGLRVTLHHESGAERSRSEVLRFDVVAYQTAEETDEVIRLVRLVFTQKHRQCFQRTEHVVIAGRFVVTGPDDVYQRLLLLLGQDVLQAAQPVVH